MDADELVAAQIAYYRARATQYDDEPRHADNDERRPEYLERLRGDVAELDAWLEADPPTGHVLEIAAGSGNRTGRLLRAADRVTAVDAAPEMLDLLAAKHPGVERIQADIFKWEPPQRYDNIYFGYWISHVPGAKWDSFWDLVDRALVGSGGSHHFRLHLRNGYPLARRGVGQPGTLYVVRTYEALLLVGHAAL